MNIFQFLIFLGIINIVFGFVWKWIVALPGAIVFTLIKFEKGVLIIKVFGAYLLVSLTAMTTLAAVQNAESWWPLIGFPLIAIFVLYLGFASNAYEQQKQARMENDYQLMKQLNENSLFDMTLTLGSIILFILILFIPSISYNSLNVWLFNVIRWAYDLPVIGWIIAIGGIFFMINIIWYGLLMSVMLVGSMFAKLKGGAKYKM